MRLWRRREALPVEPPDLSPRAVTRPPRWRRPWGRRDLGNNGAGPVSRGSGAAPPECYSRSPGARRTSSRAAAWLSRIEVQHRVTTHGHVPTDSRGGPWRPSSLRARRRRRPGEELGPGGETQPEFLPPAGGKAPLHARLLRVDEGGQHQLLFMVKASASGKARREAVGRGSMTAADFREKVLKRRTEVPTDKERLDHLHLPFRGKGVSPPGPPLGLMDGQSGDSVE